MTPLLATIVSAAISLIVAFSISYIAFRVLLERFIARMDEREKHMDKWRDEVDESIELLKSSTISTEIALLRQSVNAMTKKLEEVIEYAETLKHVHIDPYEREVALLNQRVQQMEARLEMRRRDDK